MLLWLFLLFPTFGAAEESPFWTAFQASLAAEQAKTELALLPDAELSVREREDASQKWQAILAKAKTTQRQMPDSLPSWQKQVLRGQGLPAGFQAEALAFLRLSLASPRQLPAQAWPLLRRWFGRETADKFLQEAFAAQNLDQMEQISASVAPRLVWVLDPYRRMPAAEDKLSPQDIKQTDDQIETVEVTPFPHLDEQAEGLRLVLANQPETPFVLVSNGNASAVVHRMLDLYPALRFHPNLKGWINVDGRLFGVPPPVGGRRPASVERADGIDATLALRRLRLEAFVTPAPLGEKGFPIMNLVSLQPRARETMRDALVVEASTRLVQNRPAWRAVREALPLLR